MPDNAGVPNEIDRVIIEAVLDVLLKELTKEIEDLAEYRGVPSELIWRMFKEMLPGESER